MKKPRNNHELPPAKTDEADRLRAAALARLKAAAPDQSPADERTAVGLLHELQVHQIELEMQNETLQRSQLELEESRNRYMELYDFAPVGYVSLDQKGQIMESNLTAATMLGSEIFRLYRCDLGRFVNREFLDLWYLHLAATYKHDDRQECELLLQRADKSTFFAHLTSRRVRQGNNSGVCIHTTLTDITQRKKAEEEIQHLAFYDSLTHLPNRRLFFDRLEQAFSASARSGQHGAMLFIDLDYFKTLNDTRGHDVGDLLLTIVAKRLQEIMRTDNTVSRQGGDEFVVLLNNLSPVRYAAVTRAGHVAEKIRVTLNQPIDLDGQEHHMSASIGISLFLGRDTSVDELFKRADTAMYQAKHAGRNQARFFDPAMQSTLEQVSAMEKDLRLAIEQGQFQLHYQPQTGYNGRIIGTEALLRWTHPERGPVSPAYFIPLAEENGLILPIGHWVLKEACSQLAAWAYIPAADNFKLAVNVSARQFRQTKFVAEIRQILAATGADPKRLKLELTESMVMTEVADTVNKMRELRALGIGFAMDDFGTGYSSLSQLKRLPLEQLKIDRSFVCDLGSNPHDDSIVETIIAMGRILGFQVIAEGVETKEQLELLSRYGCHAYQGYLFSQPVPTAEFEHLFTTGVTI